MCIRDSPYTFRILSSISPQVPSVIILRSRATSPWCTMCPRGQWVETGLDGGSLKMRVCRRCLRHRGPGPDVWQRALSQTGPSSRHFVTLSTRVSMTPVYLELQRYSPPPPLREGGEPGTQACTRALHIAPNDCTLVTHIPTQQPLGHLRSIMHCRAVAPLFLYTRPRKLHRAMTKVASCYEYRDCI